MNFNILRYSFFGIAGGQAVDHTFVKFKFSFLTGVCCQRAAMTNQFSQLSLN